jgi:hypothetical protein
MGVVLPTPDLSPVPSAQIVDRAGNIVYNQPASAGPAQNAYQITNPYTARPGLYAIRWSYYRGPAFNQEVTAFEVGRRAPTYQALPPPMRDLIESTYVRFADLIDSPLGGPHAGTYLQSAFDRERIAQLLHIAMSKLNIISSPHATYTIMEPDPTFPLSEWGGLLSQMLYIETIRHLRRIYVEQPETLGVNLARLDRRDYLIRWQTLQQEAQEELDTYIDSYRMAHMDLGGGVLTVAGGIYGSMAAPTRLGNMGACPPWSLVVPGLLMADICYEPVE